MSASITVQLQSIVSGLLGNEVPLDQPLMEAGLDSLGAAELRNSIQGHFSIEVPATVVFDHPTLSALSHMVSELVVPQQQASAVLARRSPAADGLGRAMIPDPTSSHVGLWGLACRYPSHASGEILAAVQFHPIHLQIDKRQLWL